MEWVKDRYFVYQAQATLHVDRLVRLLNSIEKVLDMMKPKFRNASDTAETTIPFAGACLLGKRRMQYAALRPCLLRCRSRNATHCFLHYKRPELYDFSS